MKTETIHVRLRVEGIVCYACTDIISRLAKGVPGVREAQVSYVSELLELDMDETASLEEVCAMLEKHGYRCRITGDRELLSAEDDMGILRRRILVSFFLSLFLIPYPFLPIPPWVRFLIATAVQIIAGRQFYRDAWYAVTAGGANMSVLVSLGVLTAYLFSTVSVFRGEGAIFYESCGSVLVLVMLGKYLERSARISSAEQVRRLMELGPAEARLITPEGETMVPAETLRKGDRFLVRRGELFPCDGVVLEGHSAADEANLTGESRPAAKQAGDRVFCATINMLDRLLLEAEGDYADSVYCHMRQALLNGVNGEKAGIQRMADRVCSRFVPSVLCLALLTVCLWFAFLSPGDLTRAVTNGAAVLIIACPCAMGIATPLAMTLAIGGLGGAGIFVKNPGAVEALGAVDTVVLDKTGTLTQPLEDGGERPRYGAPKTVETLMRMGISVWMLTGDSEDRAYAAADACGIPRERVLCRLLPEDKAKTIAELRRSGTVCMVGDGVNDALSLQAADVGLALGRAADVGLALGRAADVSVACADAVVTRNRIAHILRALYAGRVTMQNIRRSLFWALIYNVIGLLLAAAGIVSPLIAGAAMSLSSLSVALNSHSLDKKLRAPSFDQVCSVPRQPLMGKRRPSSKEKPAVSPVS